MRKNLYISTMAAAISLLFATGGIAGGEKDKQAADQQMQDQQQKQAVQQQEQGQSQYAEQLITADKLEGLKIQNQQGEEIGTVDKVVLDSQEGRIAYVIVTSGGFWGVGGEKAVVPWKAASFQSGQQPEMEGEPTLVLDVTRDQLKNAPEGDIQAVLDRQQAQEIHQYYGVSPYWEGGQEQQEMKEKKQDMQKDENMEKEQQKKY